MIVTAQRASWQILSALSVSMITANHFNHHDVKYNMVWSDNSLHLIRQEGHQMFICKRIGRLTTISFPELTKPLLEMVPHLKTDKHRRRFRISDILKIENKQTEILIWVKVWHCEERKNLEKEKVLSLHKTFIYNIRRMEGKMGFNIKQIYSPDTKLKTEFVKANQTQYSQFLLKLPLCV